MNSASLIVTLSCVFAAAASLHAPAAPPAEKPGSLFTEITDEVGLDFVHEVGNDKALHHPEIMGSGCAVLDFDDDGDLDLYLLQAGGRVMHSGGQVAPNRLYRQEANGSFTDVTAASGLGDKGYAMGVAVGDVDNDGLVDVYITNYGTDRLYRNEGNGRFRDVTSSAGISGDAWSASATFCDYDQDGYLDLYVTHYVTYDPQRTCRSLDGQPDYCSPQIFPGVSDVLYHNNQDGTFKDISASSTIGGLASPGLGVLCSDWNGDGLADFYIANDGAANQLWINQGNGKFRDEAFLSGAGLNAFGNTEAGMGVTAGDVDLDGDLDLFLTHLKGETNTLYQNEGLMGFEDSSANAGLGAHSLQMTGFGTAFLDLDHDGDLDLALVNGRVGRYPPVPGAPADPRWRPYAEPNSLLMNDGTGHFDDVSAQAGLFSSRVEISRGLAAGDVDGDGDLDLLVSNTAGKARLFRNDVEKKGHWLMVRAIDPALKRDAYGATVWVVVAGKSYLRVVQPGYGYQSSNDPRVHFGIPGTGTIDKLSVTWPDGKKEVFPDAKPDRLLVVRKGEGRKSVD